MVLMGLNVLFHTPTMVEVLVLGWNFFWSRFGDSYPEKCHIKALVFLNNFQVFLSKETIFREVKATFVTGVFFRHKFGHPLIFL